MIAKISVPMSGFSNIMGYHEEKVDNLKANLIYQTSLFNSNYIELIEDLKSNASQNSRVKDVCFEISLNLAHGDNLSDTQFIELANLYLEKMGWSNSPFVIHRHHDRQHEHIHITLSRVTYDGKVIDEQDNYLRSKLIVIELEKQFKLTPAVPLNLEAKLLSEIHQRNYNFHKAFLKGLKNNAVITPMRNILKDDIIGFIAKNKLTNTEMQGLLEDKSMAVFDLLVTNNHFNVLLKDELLVKLDLLYSQSKTKSDFFALCFNNNIDVQYSIKKVNGVPQSQYTYSLTDINVGFKENRLPKKYSFDSVNQISDDNSFILPSEQKHIIYTGVMLALNKASNYSEFLIELQKSHIDIKSYELNGAPMLSFGLLYSDNRELFLGEQISTKLSIANIDSHFDDYKSSALALTESVIMNLQKDQQLYDMNSYSEASGNMVPMMSPNKFKEYDVPLPKKKKGKNIGLSGYER